MDDGFRSARVLITGGVGFIGSNLANRLVAMGAEVTLVDSMIPEYGGNLWNIESVREKVCVNIADVRDDHAMKYLLQHQDILFNLAGQTMPVRSSRSWKPVGDITRTSRLSSRAPDRSMGSPPIFLWTRHTRFILWT
jgi:UDP-glucose 4-epimerase